MKKELITKIGNSKVVARQPENFCGDITVMVLNGSDIIAQEIYTGGTLKRATDEILQRLDYFTEDYLWLMVEGIERLTANTYKAGEKDYFCRVDDTEYFKHFYKSADEFTKDKNGLRIIDR